MNILKRIFLFFSILIALLLIAAFFTARIYEEEAKEIIIAQVNKNLESEISVDEIQFSFIRKFPYASLELKNIMAKEAIIKIGEPDTLLFAERLFLQFSIIDIIHKNYQIRKVEISDGFARLKIDREGYDNYQLWNSRKKQEKENWRMALEQISMNHFHFSFISEVQKDTVRFFAQKLDASGAFGNDQYELHLQGGVMAEKVAIGGVNYLTKQHIRINTRLEVNNLSNTYTFSKSNVEIGRNLPLEISGHIRDENEHITLNMQLTGSKLDIEKVKPFLQTVQQEFLDRYNSKGILHFNANISGKLSKKHHPAITANFGISDGSISHHSVSSKLEQINLKGSYSNGSKRNALSSSLHIEELKAVFARGKIESRLSVTNFENPEVKITAMADLSLQELKHFFQLDTFEILKGNLSVNLSLQGHLATFQPEEFLKANISGRVNISDAEVLIKNTYRYYQQLKGEVILHNNDIKMKHFKGNVGSSNFEFNGLFRNALPYLFLNEQQLSIDAAFASDYLNFNELLQDNSTSDTVYALKFPSNIDFNLTMDVHKISFRKFTAENILGNISWKNDRLIVQPLSFEAMSGNISGFIRADQLPSGNFSLQSGADFENIDVYRLFHQLENFGQEVIHERHLKGFATANALFTSIISPGLQFDRESIEAIVDLIVEQGELTGFEPLKDISGYVRQHKLLSAFIKSDQLQKKLEHIRFTTLKNQFRIKSQRIEIPEMEINSSAMQVKLNGIHSFDNEIDYRFSFFLSELLADKEKRRKKDFGPIENDSQGRMKVFITMKGHADDPVISYDRSGAIQNVREDVKAEEKTVKSILKEEFGLFKKDSTVQSLSKKNKAEPDFEWEEEATPDSSKTEQDKKPDTKNKNGLNKWINKIAGPDDQKKTEKVSFEEDDY